MVTPLYVYCSQCGEVPTDEIQVLDIAEDFEGRDVVTFKCKCGTQRESIVFGRF